MQVNDLFKMGFGCPMLEHWDYIGCPMQESPQTCGSCIL